MLKMRLQRVGRKNDASYRVVVTDSRTGPKSNKHVDLLGSYNPKMDRIQIDGDRAKDWISKGVQVSDTVHNILVGQKIIEGKKINVLPRKSPIVSESTETEAAPAPAKEEAAATETPAEAAAPEVAEEAPAKEEAAATETPAEEAAPEEKKEG